MKRQLIAIAIACAILAVACSGSSPEGEIVLDNAACPVDIVRNSTNGWLLTQPEVHMDFWGNWDSQQTYTPSYFFIAWLELLDQDNVLQRLAEYGIHEGTMDVLYTGGDPSPALEDGGVPEAIDGGGETPSIINDGTIPVQINAEIQLGILSYPNDNTLYVIMLAPGMTTQAMINNHWGGYHNHSVYGSQQYAYAVIDFNGSNTNVVVSHEIYEASTDPDDSTGYYSPFTGSELADVCEGNDEVIGGYTVQTVWSVALCQCQ